MRVRGWWTSVLLAGVAVACGDQPTEVVPDRQEVGVPEGQMARGAGMLALATSSSDDGLSITTDKDDYQPGDTVWFTGAGWPANDTLDILLEDQPATHEPHTWWVPVGEEGTFRDSTYVVDIGDLGVTFTLTATSRTTERWLTVVFTDNLANIRMVSATPTPFSPNQATSAGIRDLNTITLQNGNGAANGVTVRIREGEPGPSPGSQPLVRTLGSINVPSNAAASLDWDGKNTGGSHVPDGVYTARVVGSNENNGDNDKRRIVVDNTNPTVTVSPIADGTTGVEMTISGTSSDSPNVTGAGLEKVEVTIRRSSDNVVLASGLATNTGTNFSTWSFAYTPAEATAQKARAKATDNAGNNTTSADRPFTVASPDGDAPTINCSVPNPAPWYGDNVIVPCTASDPSGLANPDDASFTLSTDVGPNAENPAAGTGSRQVCDNLDNCAIAGPFSFKVDRKAPAISCGTADGQWHATDVSIPCTATDGGSGLAIASDASFNLVTSVTANTENSNASTNSRVVLDDVGNSATAGPVSGNKVDKKAPTVSCGTADGDWHATDVSIPCTGSDGGSGLASASDASFSLATNVAANTETANASTNSHAVLDDVGNSTTAGPVAGNKIDKKAPAVSCGAADGNWHAADVFIPCTVTDGGSGLANASDASFSLVTDVAAGTETNNASTDSRSVLDDVGNEATAGPVLGNMIDKKGPSVTLTCPASPVLLNAPVSATWTATDGGSGVATGYDSDSFSVPSNSVGPKTATAAPGVSHDNVGNPSSASAPCGYSVEFVFSGFRTPVDNNGTLNSANSGQAIPLKWELRDFAGNPVTTLTSVTVTVATLVCSTGSTADLIEEYAAGASGLQNHGGGSYQFNWKTPTSYARSCKTMRLDLGEGSFRTALFEFRK